jgi:ABC-type branched-chain amino acid transport systems, ATPase component
MRLPFSRQVPRDPSRGLEVRELRAGYGKAMVLQGLDLHVAPGEIVGVAGPNGAGKTTLLRSLSGVLARTARTLEFEGAPLPQDPVRVCSAGIVHVPEGRRMFANLTVTENLHVGAIGGGVRDFPAALARVRAMLPKLEPLLERKAGLLSGGQQQLVAVARGLIAQPRLLLIDELSLGLSPTAVVDISATTIQSCREVGTAVLWVDQNVSILAEHCDRLVLLKDGTLQEVSLADRSSGALASVYF